MTSNTSVIQILIKRRKKTVVVLVDELPNLFYPRRVTKDSLRLNTSQYSRCFISTTKLWNKLPSMIVKAAE